MAFCPKCGEPVQENAKFCPNCGKNLEENRSQIFPEYQQPANANDRWLITLMLCFFLGYLGIHRFYTGNTKSGIVMLLTAGGCGIWTIVDFIMILCNSYTDGNGCTLK